jgi:hypothetical protein
MIGFEYPKQLLLSGDLLLDFDSKKYLTKCLNNFSFN